MSALGQVVRAGVGRRRIQTAVMTLTAVIAVSTSILAGGLLVASDAPFDRAFAAQRGAELSAQFNGEKVTDAQLTSTAKLSGVTAAYGPFPTATVDPVSSDSPTGAIPAGAHLGPMTVVGRASPGGPVDDVALVSGRWVTGPGQIVLSADGPNPSLGTRLQVPAAPGDPTLTVVGIAQSVSRSADGWVTPAQVAGLRAAGAAPADQMLYRFSQAGTAAAMSAHRAAIAGALPPGALTGSQSYLAVRQLTNANIAAFVPFVAAFGVLGLALSVLIIGIVVSGTAGSATRRIGILKALGFTPGQVTRAYVAQATLPAVIGSGIGIILGNLLSVPVLRHARDAYGTGNLSIPIWIDVVIPACALVAVAVAALIPARRAGYLRAAEAITVGRTPRAGRGRWAQRLAGRLPLTRPLSLGLANPFTRPARTATMAAAIALGAVTVTFAFGLTVSLNHINRGRNLDSAGAVIVDAGAHAKGPHIIGVPGGGPSVAANPAAAAAAISAQPGTKRFYGTSSDQVTVSGITGAQPLIAYQGDSSWATHQMISGHWLTGAGQAVVSPRLLTEAGARVGAILTLSSGGHSTTVRIVGDVFELHDDGMDVLTTMSTMSALGLNSSPDQFNVQLQPGTNVRTYLTSLNTDLQPAGAFAMNNLPEGSGVIAAMEALISALTLLLVAAAGLGVLNTVVLDTRERVHDLGVLKAIGMTPRQTIASVLTSVAATGLIAGLIGVPLGVMLHHYVLPIMAHTTGENLPRVDVAVFGPLAIILLALGGLAIAIAGAAAPAGWAARTRTATALRTE